MHRDLLISWFGVFFALSIDEFSKIASISVSTITTAFTIYRWYIDKKNLKK